MGLLLIGSGAGLLNGLSIFYGPVFHVYGGNGEWIKTV
jgi:hypothetical protein